jgi:hypothetical protein
METEKEAAQLHNIATNSSEAITPIVNIHDLDGRVYEFPYEQVTSWKVSNRQLCISIDAKSA